MTAVLRRPAAVRPRVAGKFIQAGSDRLYLRGVTYGAFAPDAHGREFTDGATIGRDFALMAAAGINAVRIPHTIPSPLLLDTAAEHGLRVLVNLEAEQQVGHISDGRGVSRIARRLQRQVAVCAGHPALLGYTLGNEIPADVVRWLGYRRIERYLHALASAARETDPEGLVSYANYPSTEYLELPFLDFVCFNIYLESRAPLEAYLARLQNLAGDRPLVITELGLDAQRHGELAQACGIDWMVRSSFAAGCVGTFVFAWTDEWHRDGEEVSDWAFGVTDRERHPKPALSMLEWAYREMPFAPDLSWPAVSVLICSHNGAARIRECLDHAAQLDYPDLEIIVVDDGSRDGTDAVAREFGVRIIRTEHRGLSHARNAGLEAARGEIVAYLDDDSYPDPLWLKYLVASLTTSTHVGMGGPNIAPAGDGLVAECVARSPGGPTHVLLSDSEAEHIPGCNMAFRASALRAIGGFDPQFRIAGDDVDVCWRLHEQGWTLGFSPAAIVWHHCRDSVRGYWKQQRQYGRAEGMLERKWPGKYTRSGHLVWAGRLYGSSLVSGISRPARVYHGVWGRAPFQFRLRDESHPLRLLPTVPEWNLVVLALLGLTLLGAVWTPLLAAAPLLAACVAATWLQALRRARQQSAAQDPPSTRVSKVVVIAFLHVIQPLARLVGRISTGLTPWRRTSVRGFALPWSRTTRFQTEHRQEPEARLRCLEADLRHEGLAVLRGGDFDRWDFEGRRGLFGTIRILTAVEEIGAGCQLLRARIWPRWPRGAVIFAAASAALAVGAGLDGARVAAAVLAATASLLAIWIVEESATVMAAAVRALETRVPELAREPGPSAPAPVGVAAENASVERT